MLHSMKLATKILLLLLVVGVGSVALYGYGGYVTARNALERDSFNKLTAVREMKATQIEDYFRTIRHQIVTFSEDRMIVGAMAEFSEAFANIHGDPALAPVSMPAVDGRLTSYYEAEFLPRLAENAEVAPEIESYWPPEETTRILQDLFIASNSHPTGSKHLLEDAGDGSAYSRLHLEYHPIIRSYLEKFGYYDIFLVEPEGGHIVYSVFKEVDYGTSLLSGPYRDTNFGRAFRRAREAPAADFVVLEDFAPYGPSYRAQASFMASPIYDGTERIGVLLFQMPIDRINAIMTNEQRWADVGLGESGESYIVAQDFKIRNQSRFLIEDRENYFKMIEAIGTAPAVVTRIRNMNSSIGLQEVRTRGTEAALAGQTDTEVFPDYRGVPVLSSYQPLDIEDVHWVLMSEIDEAEAFAEVHRFRRNALVAFVAVIGAIVIVSLFFTRSITRRINILTRHARRLSTHDFRQDRIEVPQELTQIAGHRDEVGQLANAFSKLGDDLQRSIDNLRTTTASKERMQTELDVGRDIQMSMLPLLFPAYPEKEEFSVRSALEPAREVGGDFYDYYFLDEKRFCLCVADVSDKGVPAALFMAVTKTLIKSEATDASSAAEILTRVNDELSADNPSSMFVTVFLGILDIETGGLVYANAGHEPPLLLNDEAAGNERVTRLKLHGPVIGAMPGITYRDGHVQLKRGDFLLMFTDGVTEAMNVRGELYSQQRLVDALQQGSFESASGLVDHVMSGVRAFADGAEQADDITVLALQYLGAAGGNIEQRVEFTIKNRLEEIETAIAQFSEFASRQGVADAVRQKISVALDELLNNAITYGFPTGGEHAIDIAVELGADRLSIRLEDDGVAFNPFTHAAPDTTGAIEDRPEGGLGIHIVRNLMEKVGYQRDGEKNVTTLIKRFTTKPEGEST